MDLETIAYVRILSIDPESAKDDGYKKLENEGSLNIRNIVSQNNWLIASQYEFANIANITLQKLENLETNIQILLGRDMPDLDPLKTQLTEIEKNHTHAIIPYKPQREILQASLLFEKREIEPFRFNMM